MTHFSRYHPLTNFIFFALVIGNAMVLFHPVYMAISLVASLTLNVVTNGKRGMKFNLLFALPALILLALFNPLFNHAGATILFYFLNGNPFTLESFVYGFVSSTMFVTSILWFASSNTIITSDKLMYLFGRIIPKSSLIISMVLRFVPLYKKRIQMIAQGQSALHDQAVKQSWFTRASRGMQILSIMTTWALQSGIETASSMRARGYGLEGRTAFSNYTFTKSDGLLLLLFGICASITTALQALHIVHFSYFPYIDFSTVSTLDCMGYLAYAILCFSPCIINLWREYQWTYLISKI